MAIKEREELGKSRGTETKRGKYFKRKRVMSCINVASMVNKLAKDQVDLATGRSW